MEGIEYVYIKNKGVPYEFSIICVVLNKINAICRDLERRCFFFDGDLTEFEPWFRMNLWYFNLDYVLFSRYFTDREIFAMAIYNR